MGERVIRVQQAAEKPPVLVHIRYDSPNSFDVKLSATDGNEAYATKIRSDDIGQLRDQRYTGSEEEWDAVLKSTFYGEKQDSRFKSVLERVGLYAAVNHKQSIDLNFHQSFSGITQVLGSISVPFDRRADIDVFEWANLAVQAGENLKTQSAALRGELESKDEAVDKLQKQLEDLILAKKQHEDALLLKAMLLLNSKKAKIRDLQRQLGTSRNDPDAAESEVATEGSASGATKNKGGASKRKAALAPQNMDDDSSDGFDNVKSEPAEEQGVDANMESDDEDKRTPEASDDETDGSGFETAPRRTTRAGAGAFQPQTQPQARPASHLRKGAKKTMERPSARDDHSEDTAETVPPPRTLPFTSTPKANTGEDEETTDDEL